MKFKTFNFDLKYFGKWQFFNYEIFLRFKKSPQLPGAGRTRAGHHQRSDMPASPRARNLVVIETQLPRDLLLPTTKARTWKQAFGTPRTSVAVKKSGGKKYVVVKENF